MKSTTMTALRKGLEPCPACGKTIRPASRKQPHPETAECRALVVYKAMVAKGLVATMNITQSKMIEEAGAPLEWALAGVHVQEYAETDADGRVTRSWNEQEQHLIGFAPPNVLRVAALLGKLDLPPDFRRRAIRLLCAHPDLIDALDTKRRLGRVGRRDVMEAINLAVEM